MLLKIQDFWDEMLCHWANSLSCFEGTTALKSVGSYLQVATA